jgi:hypothetical protein
MARQRIADEKALGSLLDCQLVKLMQFEPQAGSGRTIELRGADQ